MKDEINEVFTQLVVMLADKGYISLDVEYIDGTKIESKANKYTFVWRKSTEKNRAKLMEKIKVLLEQVDDSIAQENGNEDEPLCFTPSDLRDMAERLNKSLEANPEPSTKEDKEKRKEERQQIEKALKRDIHFIWLAGYEQPDFNTINRFRNRVKNENEGRRDDERTDKTGLQPANRDREPVYP